MTVIYRYPLQIADEVVIEAPTLARWLTVAIKDGRLTVWAEVEPSRATIGYLFHIYGTGHPMRSINQHYIGTVMDVLPTGRTLVWHVYVETADE